MIIERQGIEGSGVVYLKILGKDKSVTHYPIRGTEQLRYLHQLIGAYLSDFERENPVTIVGENKAQKVLDQIRDLLEKAKTGTVK